MRSIPALAAVVLLAACGQGSGGDASTIGRGTQSTACGAAGPAAFSPRSLYHGAPPRPGPDLLYRPPADAPQLQNTGVWQAAPILVSGASAYRCGEFVYQDFLYDDHGAKALPDPSDPRFNPTGVPFPNGAGGGGSDDTFSMPNGTYTYPADPVYANNAADLVEFRVKPLADVTAFRVTLNTLKDPQRVAFTIAIGGAPGTPVAWPHGANVVSPADLFLTVHGTQADLLTADGTPVAGPAPSVAVDLQRRQYTIQIPHADWNPGRQTVRLAMGVGLWDMADHRYLLPQAIASATTPGGAGAASAPAAFFNIAFRYNAQEPMPNVAGVDGATGTATNPAWWRDAAQAAALAAGDLSGFFAEVDFAKLADGVTDDMPGQPTGVPQSGPMDRILASHFETEQGADYSQACGSSTSCKGELTGRLQPYAIYVPKGQPPAQGWGLTLLLHSLAANYNQFLASQNQAQFADRGAGSIVITPEGRGPDGWYYDYAGADTFEVWADVAARYRLNPAFTDIAGYSMGGYGTYKFATQFPDLFARAQPTVGPPGLGIWLPPAPPQPGGDQSNTNRMLASLRNIPILIWDEASDELVPIPGPTEQAATLGTLGYRYEFDTYTVGEHLTLAINDQYQPAADFLGTDEIDYNPAHVSYAYNPTMDFPTLGTASGHAYWLSGITLRDNSGSAPLGSIDVRSEGFGVGDPTPSGVTPGAGVLMGGSLAPIPYISQTQTWGAAPSAPKADRLDITASNIATVTIDPQRAKVDCNAKLEINSDGPLQVKLAGCP